MFNMFKSVELILSCFTEYVTHRITYLWKHMHLVAKDEELRWNFEEHEWLPEFGNKSAKITHTEKFRNGNAKKNYHHNLFEIKIFINICNVRQSLQIALLSYMSTIFRLC